MAEPARRILVVDDEPGIVKVVRKQLELAGFAVLVATDGVSGLAQAREARPDLVILDLMLPKLNGHEVSAALKQDAQTRHIPILMLTANARPTDEQTSRQHGADGYLTKPFALDDLLSRIRGLLAASASNG